MKLGIITDIHEQVHQLRAALHSFESERVDQVVVIGDVFETGEQIDETCRLLAAAGAVGVWGNHDFGLCHDPDEATQQSYSKSVLEFMGSLKPRYEIAGCHFSHVEPWLDPMCIDDLWYYDGMPESPGRLNRIFSAVPNRLMFAGHYHRWLVATPEKLLDWRGEEPIRLTVGRYFVVVGALFLGDFAVLDTDSGQLVPHKTGLPTETRQIG